MRHSGILMHITSLPQAGGIGTLGQAAYDFVDFLKASQMDIWQVLPVAPTGYGDSPYQSVSTYAGNPLLIDLDMMVKDGIMPSYEPLPAPRDPERVDYGAVVYEKSKRLKAAYQTSKQALQKELQAFEQSRHWVKDYARFSAIKDHFGLISLMAWPDDALRRREQQALDHYDTLLRDEIGYYVFLQYLFFMQWDRLKQYANQNGVKIFGDMPIYTAEDSADVWVNPKVFQLDEDLRPTFIAGVPPDYFSVDGQRWGNPLYDWDYLQKTGFAWWIDRLTAMGQMYDIVRIDHFIGFANYYAIPAEEATARNGEWRLAPGQEFFAVVKEKLPRLDVVAEDLGAVNQRVLDLMAFCGYPGMRILTFGFDLNPNHPNLPQNYPTHTVVYTGTHDNQTALGWFLTQREEIQQFATRMLGCTPEDIAPAMCKAAILSRAKHCILPMQDILSLDDSARMNIPGTIGGRNWQWRILPDAITPQLVNRLKTLNVLAGRNEEGA